MPTPPFDLDMELMLDANAVAGTLEQIFGRDVTASLTTCNQCGNTAAGAVAGGIAGAALGAAVGSDGHRYTNRYGYRRYNSGNRGTAAVIGGVLGAVVGGSIASSNC